MTVRWLRQGSRARARRKEARTIRGWLWNVCGHPQEEGGDSDGGSSRPRASLLSKPSAWISIIAGICAPSGRPKQVHFSSMCKKTSMRRLISFCHEKFGVVLRCWRFVLNRSPGRCCSDDQSLYEQAVDRTRAGQSSALEQ